MSSGPTHFTAAESLLASSRSISADDLEPAQLLTATLLEALTHATLANTPAPTPLADPGVVWWLDDGEEHASKPPLFTTQEAACDAAIESYKIANPFSDAPANSFQWWGVEEDEKFEDDEDALELGIVQQRTGIFVRPIRPEDGA